MSGHRNEKREQYLNNNDKVVNLVVILVELVDILARPVDISSKLVDILLTSVDKSTQPIHIVISKIKNHKEIIPCGSL
ncbi:hypothetical protein CN601_09080 [Bacillus sp. AFS017336]|nr:hypothetical protein CN601_09080 [Bacillus sp. AFS017336]